MRRYAVIGYPVTHSLSPVIHAAFAAHTGVELQYAQLEVAPEEFDEFARQFFTAGGHGLNVTVPHKQAALRLADEVMPRAQQAGAVNWLTNTGEALLGDNTDGSGLVRDMTENLGVELTGKRLLLLGAGGAARGILGPLLDCEPAALQVANRTVARAHELVASCADQAVVSACGLDDLGEMAFDVIVNATASSGPEAELVLPETLLGEHSVCYDLMYGVETAFLKWARASKCARVFDGFGMLLEQAGESFALWHGITPDVAAVRAELRPESQAP